MDGNWNCVGLLRRATLGCWNIELVLWNRRLCSLTHNWKVIRWMLFVVVSGVVVRHIRNESTDSVVRCNFQFIDDCLVRSKQRPKLRPRGCNWYITRSNGNAIDCLLSWKDKEFWCHKSDRMRKLNHISRHVLSDSIDLIIPDWRLEKCLNAVDYENPKSWFYFAGCENLAINF